MKRKQFFKQIQESLTDAMREAILDGNDYLEYEKYFGDATLHVRIYEVRLAYGNYITDEDVWVEHLDRNHASPLFEEKVRELMPDWFSIKMEQIA